MKNLDIVIVDWHDSMMSGGWRNDKDCKIDIVICQSVGFLVDETEDGICIALNRCTNDDCTPFGHLVSIPKVAIIRRSVIQYPFNPIPKEEI